MKAIVLFGLLAATASAISVGSKPVITKALVDSINNKPGITWTATENNGNVVTGANLREIKRLLGVKGDFRKKMLPMRKLTEAEKLMAIPTSFDSATHWPHCATIPMIRDQSDCGSCWAVAGASAQSDRMCTTGNYTNLPLSARDLLSCCSYCGDGCNGGYPSMAWQYWVNTGLVSLACQPYPFPKCEHHTTGPYPPCGPNEYPTPACASTCTGNSSSATMQTFQGSTAYGVSGEQSYQIELMTNGPFEVAFSVYEDFLTYKSGVYTHTTGSYLGGHAVRIVGWGVLNGQKYWKIANSWNDSWGMDGWFLIRRGTDECGIEDSGAAGKA